MNFKTVTLAAGAALLVSTPVNAANVLFRVDATIGADALAAALANSGHTVTTISGNLTSQTLSGYDLVVYSNQDSSQPTSDRERINGYLTNGGRVLYTNWTSFAPEDLPTLNSTFTGNDNGTAISLSQFTFGVGPTITLSNPGWGIFSTGLSAVAGGVVAATFGNGEAAIIVGNGGRSIHNGFLNDTGASANFYGNQIGFLLGGAIPEPATWAMMILGFGFIGGAMRYRTRSAKVSFATV